MFRVIKKVQKSLKTPQKKHIFTRKLPQNISFQCHKKQATRKNIPKNHVMTKNFHAISTKGCIKMR